MSNRPETESDLLHYMQLLLEEQKLTEQQAPISKLGFLSNGYLE